MKLYDLLKLVYTYNTVEIVVNSTCIYFGKASEYSGLNYNVNYFQSAYDINCHYIDLIDFDFDQLNKNTEIFIECDLDSNDINS